jgi:hypothetical protein
MLFLVMVAKLPSPERDEYAAYTYYWCCFLTMSDLFGAAASDSFEHY